MKYLTEDSIKFLKHYEKDKSDMFEKIKNSDPNLAVDI